MLLSWVPAPKPLPGRNVAPPSLGTPDTELAALLTLAGALWAWRGLQRLSTLSSAFAGIHSQRRPQNAGLAPSGRCRGSAVHCARAWSTVARPGWLCGSLTWQRRPAQWHRAARCHHGPPWGRRLVSAFSRERTPPRAGLCLVLPPTLPLAGRGGPPHSLTTATQSGLFSSEKARGVEVPAVQRAHC